MNLSKRQSLSNDAVSGVVFPSQSIFAGEVSRPLGFRRDGRPIYMIAGGSEDASGTDSAGGGESEEDKEEDSGSSDSSSEDGAKEPENNGDPNAKIVALQDEKDRQYRRRMDAERERDDARRELDKIKGKDKDETTKAKERALELETQVKNLTASLTGSQLEIAFLKDNTYAWHNPGRALALADLSKVEIDNDGTVHGLKEALEALAKSDPYLIKQDDEKNKVKEDKGKPPGTGGSRSGSKQGETKEARDARQSALAAKYPALRR